MKRIAAGATIVAIQILSLSGFLIPGTAHAAVSSWQKGVNIVPTSTTDYSSTSFQQSLQKFKATGGNAVALVVPYYQSNLGSTDVQAGWNTPTDAALASAIDYAHSLGLFVTLKMHVDPYTGDWRAYINPGDRNGWFTNYGNAVVHTAQIGQAHGAEMVVVGIELVSMSEDNINSTNTQNWLGLISKVRAVYKGKLSYSANSDSNNFDPFVDEKDHVGFWSALDYAGISAYYNLNSDGSVPSLQGAWDYWNNNDLKGFQSRVGKPLLFLEIGYRSVDGAHVDPWNWQRGGNYNPTEQANDYDALMGYWNNYSYMQGVYWWNWETNPNAGGSGQTSYTPQNKPAQDILTKWYSNAPAPGGGGGGAPTFSVGSVSANPASPNVSQQTTITASITNTGGTLGQGIVDLEVRDNGGNKIFQQAFNNQTINAGESRNYSAPWTPNASGTYNVAIGVFNGDWSQNYLWNGTAGSITVNGASQPPPPPPPATTTPPTNPPPTNPPPATNQTTDIWWPTNGATVQGVQPFKAMVENIDVSQYQMFWQVDNGVLNQMGNSTVDYPHKEALVDVSGWHWQSSGNYLINFLSKNTGGTTISQKSITIHVQ